MTSTHSLLEGPIGPQLRGLALPVAWGLLMIMSVNVADSWFIARLGTEPLAAFGFALPVVLFFTGIIYGMSIGTTSVLSRIYGSGNFEQVRQMTADALLLAVLIVSVAGIIGYSIIDPLFRAMGAGEELLLLIRAFMGVWYCSLPFMCFTLVGNACIRATGDTRFPSKIMTLTAVLTIIIDPFLIFGWAGFPALGLYGAGLAILLVNMMTAAVSFYVLRFRRRVLGMPGRGAALLQAWGRILHVAIPSILSNLVTPLSAAIVTWMAAGFGHEAVAALGVVSRIEAMALIVPYALNASTAILAGQNFGAGNFGRVRETVLEGTFYSWVWGLLVASALWLFAFHIPPLFDPNPDVTRYAALYLMWVPISYGAQGMLIVCISAFNAMGRPVPASAMVILKAVVFYVPLAYLLQRQIGFAGIPLSLCITNIATGIIGFLWHRKAAS